MRSALKSQSRYLGAKLTPTALATISYADKAEWKHVVLWVK